MLLKKTKCVSRLLTKSSKIKVKCIQFDTRGCTKENGDIFLLLNCYTSQSGQSHKWNRKECCQSKKRIWKNVGSVHLSTILLLFPALSVTTETGERDTQYAYYGRHSWMKPLAPEVTPQRPRCPYIRYASFEMCKNQQSNNADGTAP